MTLGQACESKRTWGITVPWGYMIYFFNLPMNKISENFLKKWRDQYKTSCLLPEGAHALCFAFLCLQGLIAACVTASLTGKETKPSISPAAGSHLGLYCRSTIKVLLLLSPISLYSKSISCWLGKPVPGFLISFSPSLQGSPCLQLFSCSGDRRSKEGGFMHPYTTLTSSLQGVWVSDYNPCKHAGSVGLSSPNPLVYSNQVHLLVPHPPAALPCTTPGWLEIQPSCMCDQNCKTEEGKAQNSKINGVHLVDLLQTPWLCSPSTCSAVSKGLHHLGWAGGCAASCSQVLKWCHQSVRFSPRQQPVTTSPVLFISPLSRLQEAPQVCLLFTPPEGKSFSSSTTVHQLHSASPQPPPAVLNWLHLHFWEGGIHLEGRVMGEFR